MARKALSLSGIGKVGHSDADPAGLTTLAAAMAVLVADGASPTQAHVTTANTALTNVTPVDNALLVSFDAAVFTTVSKLRAGLNAIIDAAYASSMAP